MSTFLEAQRWRYATKKFDPTRTISEEQLQALLTAAQLSASSYGLQPYRVLVVTDPAIREQLRPAAWNQSQITEASHLIVIANQTDFDESLIDNYIDNASVTRGVDRSELDGYGQYMKKTLVPMPKEAKAVWTTKQCYIVLGNLLAAAATMKIDSCPMEGFEPEKFNQILGLKDKGLNAAVLLTVGYRSEEDATQHLPKVRRQFDNLIHYI